MTKPKAKEEVKKEPELEPVGAVEADDLSELDSLKEPDFDPVEEEKENKAVIAAEELKRQEAKAAAAGAVGVVRAVMSSFFPDIKVGDAESEKVAEKLEAVMYKYDCTLPPWLMAYREELEFAGVLGMVGFSIHAQVKAAKLAELKAKKEAEAAGDGKESERAAA